MENVLRRALLVRYRSLGKLQILPDDLLLSILQKNDCKDRSNLCSVKKDQREDCFRKAYLHFKNIDNLQIWKELREDVPLVRQYQLRCREDFGVRRAKRLIDFLRLEVIELRRRYDEENEFRANVVQPNINQDEVVKLFLRLKKEHTPPDPFDFDFIEAFCFLDEDNKNENFVRFRSEINNQEIFEEDIGSDDFAKFIYQHRWILSHSWQITRENIILATTINFENTHILELVFDEARDGWALGIQFTTF
jgi:hypothetical protein